MPACTAATTVGRNSIALPDIYSDKKIALSTESDFFYYL